MSTLQTVLSRGTAASRPASASVPVGSLYFETDTQLLKRNNGATWDTFAVALLVGDSGAGGIAGFAPAPGAGDAGAGKFLKADGTWAAPAIPTGKIGQIVRSETGAVATGSTIIPFDDTIPQNTEGDQYMSQAITPLNSGSTLMIEVCAFCSVTTTPWITVALYQDTTVNAIAAVSHFINLSTTGTAINMRHFIATGSTSATTFKVRIGPSGAATITFNGQSGGRIFGGVAASSITVTEITP